jgi:hypothetical protein
MIVVENGSGLSNAETYISVADATAYFSNLKVTTWTGADATKEAALRKATRFIDDRYRFLGMKGSQPQALQWPRFNAYQDGYLVPSNIVPDRVKWATAEAALIALTGELQPTLPATGGERAIRVDVISVEYFEGSSGLETYTKIDDLLRSLTGARGGTRLERA